MLNRFRAWVSSWGSTLHIMIFERELYHELRRPLDPDDYVEVDEFE